MKAVFQSAGLAAVLALALPLAAAEEKKDKDPETLEKMIAAGTLVGKIVQFKETNKELKLQVDVGMAVPNAYHVKEVARIQTAALNDTRIKDPIKRQLRLQERAVELAYHQARTVDIKRKTEIIDLLGSENMKVRVSGPPKKYDDKGSLIKLTKKDLDDLKGPDKKMPGYMGELSHVQKGQIVQVTLAKKKTAPGEAKNNPAANLLQATMILIVRDVVEK